MVNVWKYSKLTNILREGLQGESEQDVYQMLTTYFYVLVLKLLNRSDAKLIALQGETLH